MESNPTLWFEAEHDPDRRRDPKGPEAFKLTVERVRPESLVVGIVHKPSLSKLKSSLDGWIQPLELL